MSFFKKLCLLRGNITLDLPAHSCVHRVLILRFLPALFRNLHLVCVCCPAPILINLLLTL